MADPLNVLFKQDPGRNAAIGSIILDATVEERHDYSNTITENPIEAGGFVTDHVYENPRMLDVTGEITDSPVQFFSALNGVNTRRIEAKDQLVALHKAREVVTVVTGLEIYTDVIMENLSFPRNQKTGQRLQFSATFKQAKFVNSEIVGIAAEKAKPEFKDKVSENKDLGRQEGEKLSDPQEAKAGQVNGLLTRLFN